MITRNYKKTESNKTRKGRDPKRWGTYVLFAACVLMLVTGFFLAGRQHFSSMDVEMKNSRLRKQIDGLEAEKRRLLMTREVALSPAEIKKAIKKNGLLEVSATQGQIAQIATATKEKAVPPAPSQMNPMIVKTASVAAVRPSVPQVEPQSDKTVKREVRKTLATE